MKKSLKDQTTRAFQTGGYNPPAVPQPTQPYSQPTQVDPRTGTYTLPGTGIAGYQVPSGTPTGYTPYGGATPYFQPVQFTDAQYQTALQTTNLPTFAETVGSKPGQYDELRTYINDAGQTLQIPFKDGRPIYPIPEGYRPIGDQPAPEEEQTTVTPTLGETTVRDEGGGDRDRGYTINGVEYGSAQSATKAQQDRYGITGTSGINVGAVLSILTGNPLGALASVSGFGGTPSTAFGKEPAPGTGSLNPAELGLAQIGKLGSYTTKQGVVQGPLTQDQIAARMEAMSNLGVTMTGKLGYNPGDAVPGMPGAVMGLNGVARNPDGSVAKGPNGVPTYSSVLAFLRYVSLTQEEKQAMADREAEIGRVNKEYADAVAESATTGESYSGGPESMADAVAEGRDPTGTGGAFSGEPTGMADEYDDDMPSFDDEAEAADDADAGQPSGNDAGDDDGGGGTGGGGGAGSAGASGTGCFAAGTKFFMQDGSLKSVENIKVGDIMMDGGKVRLSIVGDGSNSDWYMYGATKVTGSHPVREQGVWKFIRDAENAIRTETENLLYTIVNANHRMVAEDKVVYSDYDMVDEDGIEEELLEMMNLQDVVEEAA